jgi:type I restriction enzyme S subunit
MKYGKLPPQETSGHEGFPIYTGYRIAGFCDEYLYNEPEVIVVARGVGGTGDVKMSPEKSWITNLSIVLSVDTEHIDKRFLLYRLGQEPLKEKLNTGAAQAQITIENLQPYPITIPSIATQRRIAGILSAYDDLIENNRRRMALVEEAARQLYREWFVRLRFPGHEHTRITDGVPEGWERVPTPDAVDINPSTKLSDEVEHWSVEMADLSLNSMVIQKATRREGRSGSKFKNGDTLFARITPCLENGKTAFVDFLEEGEVARGSTEFIVLRSRRLTPEFVYLFARTYDFRENAIKSMVGSSGRQRVQQSCFEKFLALVPSGTLLNVFTETVRPMFRQMKTLHSQNQKLRAGRDLLLPRLMSGEIAV